MINTLILDFDGTLADTKGIILRTMSQTLEAHALPNPGEETCAATIGLPLDEAFDVITRAGRDVALECAATYRRLFELNNTADAVRLFPNVGATLAQLHARGTKMAIASSRGHHSLADFVERFHMLDIVEMIVGADDVTKAKPDPEPVERILQALNVSADTTLVVGDTAFDIEMGRRAGAMTCGVTYGNGTPESLRQAGADHVADNFADIARIVETC